MRSFATALLVPVVLAAGVYVYVTLEHPTIVVPTGSPPDTAQRLTKSEPSYLPSQSAPKPTAVPAVASSRTVVRRPLGPGIYKCEESNGAVSYSEFPCGDGSRIDTRPTSGGFADQWSISVKQR